MAVNAVRRETSVMVGEFYNSGGRGVGGRGRCWGLGCAGGDGRWGGRWTPIHADVDLQVGAIGGS